MTSTLPTLKLPTGRAPHRPRQHAQRTPSRLGPGGWVRMSIALPLLIVGVFASFVTYAAALPDAVLPAGQAAATTSLLALGAIAAIGVGWIVLPGTRTGTALALALSVVYGAALTAPLVLGYVNELLNGSLLESAAYYRGVILQPLIVALVMLAWMIARGKPWPAWLLVTVPVALALVDALLTYRGATLAWAPLVEFATAWPGGLTRALGAQIAEGSVYDVALQLCGRLATFTAPFFALSALVQRR